MQALSAARLLEAWERGRDRLPYERALILLHAAHPDAAWEQLQELPIGVRDARLLTVRETLFGPRLHSEVACPACGERLEFGCDVSDLRVPEPVSPEEGRRLTLDGFEIRFRPPNGEDVAVVAQIADSERRPRALLARCLTSVRREGAEVAAAALPSALVESVAAAMRDADPQAYFELALSCPHCAHAWRSPLDVAAYLWAEVQAWSTQILREIHGLASAYGWREADILALSPWRRRAYLEMLGP